MAKFVMKDCFIEIDGNDLSKRASQVTVEAPTDEVDMTTFQGGGYREFGQGLKDATITCSFFQDFAAGQVDAVLWPLFNNDVLFTIKVKANSLATSATNPAFWMVSKLYNYSPLAGAVGEASTTDVTFRNASSNGLMRITT